MARDVVKCPVHDEELNWQYNPDGSKYAVCICNTNGMRNRWQGKAVVYVRNPKAETQEEVTPAETISSEPAKYKRSK